MSPHDYPWEHIYQQEGAGEKEPFPRFYEVVEIFKEFGCYQILGLGCGSGRNHIPLALEGLTIVGMDFSPTALK